jgi:hypothetical protein
MMALTEPASTSIPRACGEGGSAMGGKARKKREQGCAAVSVHTSNRASSRRTCVAGRWPRPRGVGTRRLLRAAAMPLKLVIPSARIALDDGGSFLALSSARAVRASAARRVAVGGEPLNFGMLILGPPGCSANIASRPARRKVAERVGGAGLPM